MTGIEIIDRLFREGALEQRWQLDSGVFTNTPPSPYSPRYHTALRSIKNEDGTYLAVMDFDFEKFCQRALDVSKRCATTIRNYLKVDPVLKFSGNTGIQVMFGFIGTLDEMKDAIYTVLFLSDNSDIEFVMPAHAKSKPYLDMSMCRKRQLVRSYTIHHKSGLFSVPFLMSSTLGNIVESAKTGIIIEEARYMPENYYKYSSTEIIYGAPVVKRRNIPVMSSSKGQKFETNDNIYGSLPDIMKNIVRMKDPTHDDRVAVCSFIYFFFGLNEDDMLVWLSKNVAWADFDPTSSITQYHIGYIGRFVERCDHYRVPVKGEYLNAA